MCVTISLTRSQVVQVGEVLGTTFVVDVDCGIPHLILKLNSATSVEYLHQHQKSCSLADTLETLTQT